MDEISVTILDEVVDDEVMKWATITQMSYGSVSIVFMILFFLIIGVKKHFFQSSFYFLVRFDMFTNFLVYCNTWVAIRFDYNPWTIFIPKAIETIFPGLLTYLKYMPYFWFHLHFYTSALLTAHRLSSVAFPYNYEKFWKSLWSKSAIMSLTVIFSHVPNYWWDGHLYEVFFENGQLVCITYLKHLQDSYDLVGVCSVIYFGFNLTLFYKATRKTSSFIIESNQKKEITRKMNKIALTYATVYFLEVTWSVFNFANNYLQFLPLSLQRWNNLALTFASDVFTLSLPYILAIYDKNIRRALCGEAKPSTNTTGLFVTS
ncbi:Protein CBG24761 [Caenorhabditis briggsae]|uniref:Serpentine receptor class gamma n=1 Tax=Caenorhabditis briggsae TaxID=6238 RepID=A8WLF1_CAEBR|nr:Protein CBG24761 [Caenorhabditis briggsae]CAP21296.2 Protein CBG24761 [Caenorhabditis briggsae]